MTIVLQIEGLEFTANKIGHGVIDRDSGAEGTIVGIRGHFIQVKWPNTEHPILTAPRDLIWM